MVLAVARENRLYARLPGRQATASTLRLEPGDLCLARRPDLPRSGRRVLGYSSAEPDTVGGCSDRQFSLAVQRGVADSARCADVPITAGERAQIIRLCVRGLACGWPGTAARWYGWSPLGRRDLLIATVHRICARAERRVTEDLLSAFRKVTGEENILFTIAGASLARPSCTSRTCKKPASRYPSLTARSFRCLTVRQRLDLPANEARLR